MSSPHRVAIVGMGKRGTNHFDHFQDHPSFRVVGVCDRNRRKLARYDDDFVTTTTAKELLCSTEPDVFCLCTPPKHGWIRSSTR